MSSLRTFKAVSMFDELIDFGQASSSQLQDDLYLVYEPFTSYVDSEQALLDYRVRINFVSGALIL